MNSNQLKIVNFLTEYDFYDSLEELNGDFKSVPKEVYDSWENLNTKEKLEAVKKATEILLADLK